MHETIAFGASYAGLLALALAKERHQREVWGRTLSAAVRTALQFGGWMGLGAALAACAARLGWSSGLASWLGLLSVAGLTVSVLLAYRPHMAFLSMPAVLALIGLIAGL